MSEESVRSYRGTKIFTYSEPLALETIFDTLSNVGHIVREEPNRDVAGSKITIESSIEVDEPIPDVGLFGKIRFKKQELNKQDGMHYMTIIPFDFLICQEPSTLIIHGSRRVLMERVVEGLERAIHFNNDPRQPNRRNPDDSPAPFFIPYDNNSFNKFVVKKIVKRMEEAHERNILYDPHFQQLRDNVDIRGGECFWRRDGISASEDERFCYLFELCTYWAPELLIASCGGINSLTINDRIKVTINSDFSFTFSKFIRKEHLDIFWNSIVLPILIENNYDQERIECVQSATDYEARLKSTQ